MEPLRPSSVATHKDMNTAPFNEDRLRIRAEIPQIIVVIGMIVGILYVLLGRPYLPDQFGRDSEKIQNIARGTLDVSHDPSFQRVGEIYGAIGVANDPALAGALGFGVYCAALLPVIKRRYLDDIDVVTLIILAFALVLGVVFLGTFSKDFLVVPAIAIALYQTKKLSVDLFLMITMGAYAALFRDYWFLVMGLFLVLRFVNWKTLNIRLTILSLSGVFAFLAVAFPRILGVQLNHYRDKVNIVRDNEDARTMILSYLPIGGEVGGWANTVLTLFLFAVPLPLLLLGTLYHSGLFLYFATLWGKFFTAVRKYLDAGSNDVGVNRLVILVISFTAVQAVFEPDYGSYLRHLTPFFPLIIVAFVRMGHLARSETIEEPR